MKKPKTQLGKQIEALLNKQGDDYVLLSSAKEYDTFQLEFADHQVMDIVCHEYPNLAHGVMLHSKSNYALPDSNRLNALIIAANNANLKTTSVIAAIEHHSDEQAFTVHFKSFTHLNPQADNKSLINEAMELHLTEMDEIILPHFKNMNKEES